MISALQNFLEPWHDANAGDRYTLWVCFTLCTSLIFMGFDGGVLSVQFGSQSFISEYNMSPLDTGNFSIAVWPPTVLGSLVLAPLISRFSPRRPFFYVASVTLIIGCVLQTIGVGTGMLYTGRVIAGLGTGLIANAFNSYVVEVTRPQLRGFAMSFNQFAYNFGVFLSFWVGLGTSKITPAKFNWRAISAIQCLWGIVVIVAAFFAPESPRQLLYLSNTPTDTSADRRSASALYNLARLRKRSVQDPELLAEFRDLAEAEQYQRDHKLQVSYGTLFRSASFWKRWGFGAFAIATGQLSGISALLVYGIIVFTSLGFTSTKTSYFLNALGGSVQLLAGLFPMLYIDRLGRRTILLFGVLIAEIGLVLLSGLFNRWPQADNHGAAVVCVMAIYFVFIGYSGGTGVAGTTIAIEIWPQFIRSLGFGLSSLGQASVIVAIQKGFPEAIAKIGPKMYYVFLGMNTLVLLVVFFLFPETKQLDLESMNRLFGEIDVMEAVHRNQALRETDEKAVKGQEMEERVEEV